MKGLGEIVISAGVKPGHLLTPGTACREDQDGGGDMPSSPTLQHRHAVDLGQAQIQNDRIIGLSLAQKLSVLAVSGIVHHLTSIA